MGWRDFLQPPDLVEKKEKKEKTPAEVEKIPFIPFIPSGLGNENPDLTLMARKPRGRPFAPGQREQ